MSNRARPRHAIVILAGVFIAWCGLPMRAQSAPTGATAGSVPAAANPAPRTGQQLPNPTGQSAAEQQPAASIYGTVTDPLGNVVVSATVALENEADKSQQTATTDSTGFFRFSDLPAGRFRIDVTAEGFAPWIGTEITLSAGRYYNVPDIALRIAPATTDVQVALTRYELAEVQIKDEEQQRLLGVLPNFYTSYIWRAAPLTTGQKFRLAVRTSVDPVTFAVNAATAGVEQATDAFSGYGQGAQGYGKRFGAAYADDVIDTMIGSAFLPSILHQDPRYFYKGTGSIRSRALYAISTVVICRGDNGRSQPNYSNVFGNLISAGISNLYYPASNRNGAGVTIDNALIGTAEGAATALLQEFVFKKLSRGVPPGPAGQP